MSARYCSAVTSEPLIPSQQCSFSGRRTVLMFQVSIEVMLVGPVDPSKVVPPCVGGEHMYSEPARFTPSRRTVAPVVSTSLLPWARSAFAAKAAYGFVAVPPDPPSAPPPVPADPELSF